MSIQYISGSVFDAGTEAIAYPVSSQGPVSGEKYLDIRSRYPHFYDCYVRWSVSSYRWPGDLFTVILADPPPRYIIGAPDRIHESERPKIRYIDRSLKSLVEWYAGTWFDDKYRPKSLAMPAFGVGKRGIKWKTSKSLIEKYFGSCGRDVVVCVPSGELGKQS